MNATLRTRPPLLLLATFAAMGTLSQCRDAAAAPPAPVQLSTAAQEPAQGTKQVATVAGPVRIMLSGSLEGRLEPCGCASGQLGGLARRAFQLQSGQWDLLLEGGDLVSGSTELDFLKFYKIVEILFSSQRPYDALGVGAADLALDLDGWATILSGMQVPVVASDLESPAETWPGKPFVEKDVRDTKVRIGSLTLALPKALAGEKEPRVKLLAPEEGWHRAMEGAAQDTLRILMVHGNDAKARELAASLQPRPDLVVACSGDHVEPKGTPDLVGTVPVVYPGTRGRLLVDLTLARTDEGPVVRAYNPIRLEGSATRKGAMEDAGVKEAILQHRTQVKEDGVLAKMANRTPTATGAAYVGSESCATCHPNAYETMLGTKHAQAWETLVLAENDPKRYGWPVTSYPDCVDCHVVGYGEQSGFVDADKTPHLAGVGCEQCHGPASEHVKNPLQNKLGKVGGGTPAKVCTSCHDFEQSPDFDYAARWERIRHGKN
ncbi:MAG: hypothetical protein RL148_284 [Planctomycetota bacterium]|jgi:hypothetical protein